MNDPTTTTTPSPFAPPTAQSADMNASIDVGVSARLQNPWALFAVAASVAIGLAAVVGFAIGTAIFAASASSCSPSDGWCELGAVLIGVAVGVLAAAITYTAAGVATISRCRPKGRRAGHVVAHLVAPFGLGIALALLDALVTALG